MENWNLGYHTDIDYTYGYFSELNPLRIKLAFLQAGIQYPEVKTACELGYGQGISINIHAAASKVTWHGTDFNPAQANFAQNVASHSEADISLQDDSFEEYFKRDDLPDFDFICLHGIWSWVNNDTKQIIINFLKKKLKVGGVLYISYNALPGWASRSPLRHLLATHASRMGIKGMGDIAIVENSLAFVDSLVATQPLYSQNTPAFLHHLDNIKTADKSYLLHEYFNQICEPMNFTDMESWLSKAKLDFVCSAGYSNLIPLLNFTPEQQLFLNSISDTLLKETTRDFILNTQFRKDYWVRGACTLSPLERIELLRAQKVMLVSPIEKVSLIVSYFRGTVALSKILYLPILQALAKHNVRSIHDLELVCQNIPASNILDQVVEAVILLASYGHIISVQDNADGSRITAQVQAINSYSLEKAYGDDNVGVLASPLSGGGIKMGRIEQLFLLAVNLGNKTPEDLANYVWKIVSTHSQYLMRDGVALDTTEENIKLLQEEAIVFLQETIPRIKLLKLFDIAD